MHFFVARAYARVRGGYIFVRDSQTVDLCLHQTIYDKSYHQISPEGDSVLLLEQNAGGRRMEVFSTLVNGSYAIVHVSNKEALVCDEHRQKASCQHRAAVWRDYFEEVTDESTEESNDASGTSETVTDAFGSWSLDAPEDD